MKLIATLATLAALVCQTEAVTTANSVKTHAVDVKAEAPCGDALTFEATTTVSAVGDKFSIQLDGITTAKTALADVSPSASWQCNGAAVSGLVTAAPAITKDGTKTTWEFTTAAICAAGAFEIKLKNLCTPGIHDFKGDAIGLKFKFATTTAPDTAWVDATTSVMAGPTALAGFKVTKMPIAAATEGEFEATFTGIADTTSKATLNLPDGYTVPAGSICKVGPKAAPTLVTPSGGTAAVSASPANSKTFSVAVTLTAADSIITCTKVKSGTTVTYDALKTVALKLGDGAGAATRAGYDNMLSASPTAKPTAKAADSPASVATASGVVVGALGVAALFLA